MADEAVTPDGERARPRRNADGFAGEWVRAVDTGDEGRARWIEGDEPALPARPARPRGEREPGTEPPVA